MQKKYRLQAQQRANVENGRSLLNELICEGTDCVEVIKDPVVVRRPKNVEKRGYYIKWEAIISMETSPECTQEFFDRITGNHTFNVRRLNL